MAHHLEFYWQVVFHYGVSYFESEGTNKTKQRGVVLGVLQNLEIVAVFVIKLLHFKFIESSNPFQEIP
jgi:hypothetical protein